MMKQYLINVQSQKRFLPEFIEQKQLSNMDPNIKISPNEVSNSIGVNKGIPNFTITQKPILINST